MSDKTLLEQWRGLAYDQQADKQKLEKLWNEYFEIEKGIYAELLKNPDEEVKGTVKELAEKYGQSVLTMTGFLDGINDSLKTPNPKLLRLKTPYRQEQQPLNLKTSQQDPQTSCLRNHCHHQNQASASASSIPAHVSRPLPYNSAHPRSERP